MESLVRVVQFKSSTFNGMKSRIFFLSIFSCFAFLVFSISAASAANYQKIAPGDTVTLGELVFDDDFVATTTDCWIGITDPLNVERVASTTLMTANDDGWHYYNYTTAEDAVSGVWPSIMICGSVQRGDLVIVDKSFIVDWSLVSTSTIKEVVDESLTVATSSLSAVITAHIDTVSETASSSIVSQILSSIAGIPALVWDVTIRTLTGAGLDTGSLATLSDIQTATSSLASILTAEIQNGWTVTLSDFGETTVNTAYKAKLQVLNYATVPTDADSLPTVTITDSLGTVQVSGAAMTKDSNGTYSYSYSIGGSAVGGVWETVVSVVINGQTVKVNDYWSLSSSPADVQIIEITDKVIPLITANVRIDNMGTSASDFYYIYCIVSSEANLCGGNDDIDYASDTAYINAGSFINLALTLDEMTTAGTYWFKVKARALAETNWAASTEQFVAESGTVIPPVIPPTGGGGGGGGGGGEITYGTGGVTFSGRADPGSLIRILKDAQLISTTRAGTNGSFYASVTGLSAGTYIFSLYSEDEDGRRSDLVTFPTSITAGVTANITDIVIAPATGDVAEKCDKRGDVNADCKVNLVDFSIVAYWYGRTNPPKTVDINGDGKINLVDFSIMAYNWTG